MQTLKVLAVFFGLAIVGLVILVTAFGQRPSSTPLATTAPPTAVTPRPTISAPTATTKPASTAVPTLPSVGDTVATGNWEIGVLRLDGAPKLGDKQAQGAFLIVTIAAKNLHKETSTLNSFDFEVSTPNGVKYKTSNDGSTGLLGASGPEVLWLTVQIQPGLTKQLRTVFDVNPADTGLVLKAAGIQFRL